MSENVSAFEFKTVSDDTERRCLDCDVVLTHSGRGRPPTRCKSCAASARHTPRGDAPPKASTQKMPASGSVAQAMVILKGYYSGIGMALVMFCPPAATAWNHGRPQLESSAETALQGDPALVKSICSVGKTSSRGSFILAHIIAAAPVVAIIMEEQKKNSKKKGDDNTVQFPTPKTMFG